MTENWGTKSRMRGRAKTPGRYKDPTGTGLILIVSPKLKTRWQVRYRNWEGRECAPSLGEFADEDQADGHTKLTVEQAREKATALIKAEKVHPDERSLKDTLTLKTGFEAYIKDNRTKRHEKPLAPTTIEIYKRSFNTHLKPAHNWNLAATKTRAWTELLKKIKEENGLSPARNCVALISGIYRLYIVLDELESNPARNLYATRLFPKPEKRRSKLTEINLTTFIAGIEKVRTQQNRDIVWLLLLTGMRKRALLQLRWSRLDLQRGLYRVQEQAEGWKSWKGIYPLGSQALEILRRRHKERDLKTDWVFPARHGKRKAQDLPQDDIRESVRTAAQDTGTRLMPHDLRRTLAGAVHRVTGKDNRAVGLMLTHAWSAEPEEQTTEDYIPADVREWQALATQVGAFICEKKAGAVQLLDVDSSDTDID